MLSWRALESSCHFVYGLFLRLSLGLGSRACYKDPMYQAADMSLAYRCIECTKLVGQHDSDCRICSIRAIHGGCTQAGAERCYRESALHLGKCSGVEANTE